MRRGIWLAWWLLFERDIIRPLRWLLVTIFLTIMAVTFVLGLASELDTLTVSDLATGVLGRTIQCALPLFVIGLYCFGRALAGGGGCTKHPQLTLTSGLTVRFWPGTLIWRCARRFFSAALMRTTLNSCALLTQLDRRPPLEDGERTLAANRVQVVKTRSSGH